MHLKILKEIVVLIEEFRFLLGEASPSLCPKSASNNEFIDLYWIFECLCLDVDENLCLRNWIMSKNLPVVLLVVPGGYWLRFLLIT